jgi:hypothetical protein
MLPSTINEFEVLGEGHKLAIASASNAIPASARNPAITRGIICSAAYINKCGAWYKAEL